MFLESEAKFQKLEKNKGEITTDKEKIEYMNEEIELLKDLVVKLEILEVFWFIEVRKASTAALLESI